MCARVSAGSKLSDPFNVTNRVKQGCILAPLLLILFYVAMLKEAMSKTTAEIYICFRMTGKLFNLRRLQATTKVVEELIQELLYADDCALFAHSEKELKEMSDLSSAAAVSFGLTINLTKTEVMHQRPPNDTSTQAEVNIVLNGVKLNEVPHFTYLGSILSNDALLDGQRNLSMNQEGKLQFWPSIRESVE